MPETARAERPTIMPIMAITTSSSTREKAWEEEIGDRKAETGNGEGRGNSPGGAEAQREEMLGVDRLDGFPSWLGGFV